jgi:hypothetical protein
LDNIHKPPRLCSGGLFQLYNEVGILYHSIAATVSATECKNHS